MQHQLNTETLSRTFEIMKFILCLLVVAGHVCNMYSSANLPNLQIENWGLSLLRNWIYLFHMPAFFALSGSLFYYMKNNLGKYDNPTQFIRKKSVRLLIPYLIFASIIVMPTLWVVNLIAVNPIKYALYNIVLAIDVRHLWFLISLFIMFVAFNSLHKILNKYPFATFVVLLIANLFPIPATVFQIHNVLHYSVYFFLGYYIVKWFPFLDGMSNRNKCCIFATFIIISITIPQMGGDVLGILSTILMANLLSATRFSKSKTVKYISKNSYGIYLFHPMLIYLAYYLFKDLGSSYYFAISVFAGSLIISVIATMLIRRCNLSFVIGEPLNRSNLLRSLY